MSYTHIYGVPDPLLAKIFFYLTKRDKRGVRQTCRKLRQACDRHSVRFNIAIPWSFTSVDYLAYMYCLETTGSTLTLDRIDDLGVWFLDPWPSVVVLNLCELPSKLPTPYSPNTRVIKIVSNADRVYTLDKSMVPNLVKVLCERCRVVMI